MKTTKLNVRYTRGIHHGLHAIKAVRLEDGFLVLTDDYISEAVILTTKVPSGEGGKDRQAIMCGRWPKRGKTAKKVILAAKRGQKFVFNWLKKKGEKGGLPGVVCPLSHLPKEEYFTIFLNYHDVDEC